MTNIKYAKGNHQVIESIDYAICKRGGSIEDRVSSHKTLPEAIKELNNLYKKSIAKKMDRKVLIMFLNRIALGITTPKRSTKNIFDELDGLISHELEIECRSIIRKWPEYSGDQSAPVPDPTHKFRSSLTLKNATYEEIWGSGVYAESNRRFCGYIATKLVGEL